MPPPVKPSLTHWLNIFELIMAPFVPTHVALTSRWHLRVWPFSALLLFIEPCLPHYIACILFLDIHMICYLCLKNPPQAPPVLHPVHHKYSGVVSGRMPWTGPPTTIGLLHFLFLLSCPWPTLLVSLVSAHIVTSKRPSLTTLSKIDYLTSKSCFLIPCFIFLIAVAAIWNSLIWLTLLSVSLAGMWITGGQGPFLFTLKSPVLRTVSGI